MLDVPALQIWWPRRKSVTCRDNGLSTQDYTSLCVAVTICSILVNIRTHTQTAFWPAYMKRSASWAKSWRENLMQLHQNAEGTVRRPFEQDPATDQAMQHQLSHVQQCRTASSDVIYYLETGSGLLYKRVHAADQTRQNCSVLNTGWAKKPDCFLKVWNSRISS